MTRPTLPSFPLPVLLVPLCLAACIDTDELNAGPEAPSVANLGLVTSAQELASDGDLALVAAREFQAGRRDLNGDGDAFDLVAYVIDLATGTARNTGLALEPGAIGNTAVVGGDLALFAASEASGGGRDLNGDGDAADVVAFVHDRRDGTTRSLALAVTRRPGAVPTVAGERAAFAVSEADQGRDLDGDGLRTSDVLHLYDATTHEVENTGLAAPSRLFLAEGSVAFFVDEADGDRNEDGDQLDDFVLRVLDLVTLETRDSGLATDGAPPVFTGGAWLFTVPEDAQGEDLDGDGERTSNVLHSLMVATGETRNLGLACVDRPCAVASNGRVAFRALTAFGDAPAPAGPAFFGTVSLYVYDPLIDVLGNLGLSAFTPPVVAAGNFALLVDEVGQASDLDGDGEIADTVAVLVNPLTLQVDNLAQEALALRPARDFLLLARQESQAGEDWNLDGDLLDVVVHVYDPTQGRTVNTRLASADAFGASADQVLLYVDEGAQRLDLNHDGDLSDQVFVLFDLAEERGRSLNLAGGFDDARFGRLNEDGRLLFLANERAQGRDLDGDGDLADDVLFRGR